jgi:hypothetical protein
MKRFIVPTAFFMMFWGYAYAGPGDICKATPVRDIHHRSELGGDYVEYKGEELPGVTQYWERGLDDNGKFTGPPTLCWHGGGCYPARDYKLLNCSIDPKGDGEGLHGLTVIRSKTSSFDLRLDALSLRLSRLGMSSAGSSNAAYTSLKEPDSQCGKLVNLALRGSKSALNKLEEGNMCDRP